MSTTTRMVADVGGTNTRIALYDPVKDELRGLRRYVNRKFTAFEAVVARWLDELTEAPPTSFCIAAAAPPAEDRVAMTNIDWSFSCAELAHQFGFHNFGWVNDFAGVAHALPHLGPDDRQLLYAGSDDPTLPTRPIKLAALGPGTGLGGATVTISDTCPQVWACEPGHMGLSVATELELTIVRRLLLKHGAIHAELLISGPGLQRLYDELAAVQGLGWVARNPAQITTAALAGDDPLCVQAVTVFCAWLGSLCGDFVLANGAYGGVYLAGGIVPQIPDLLRASDFRQRFISKGAMQNHLSSVPVYTITHNQPGLLGAAHAPLTSAV